MTSSSSSRRRTRRIVGLVAVSSLALGLTGVVAANAEPFGASRSVLSKHGGAADHTPAKKAGHRWKGTSKGKVKNVILLIGDGLGDSEETIARYYDKGAAGRFDGLDALAVTGDMTTYSLDPSSGLPDYAPDSAATGSAWSTGTKTYDGAISVDLDGTPQTTLLELAKQKGMKTGNVSTAEIQDATPAVEMAHISQRGCKGPVATTRSCSDEALENGGPGSISEQILDTRPDVVLGGGASYFDEAITAGDYAGQSVLDRAEAEGFQLVDDLDGLQSLRRADQKSPVLGLFASGNMPVAWEGPDATADGGTLAPSTCTDNAGFTPDVPRLADMTEAAIDLLDGSKKGFFLQVESASIDKQDHASNACGQIGETVQHDEAVKIALDYAETHPGTLVIATADHAHTSQIVQAGTTTPGATVNLLTADGAPMTISYATAGIGSSQQHTGAQVPIGASGPGADAVAGVTDQSDIFFTVSNALGLK